MIATGARLIGSLAVAGLILATPGSARAQEARGIISGRVLDTSKGVVPGASVTITNVAMGTSVTLTTNDVGFFRLPP